MNESAVHIRHLEWRRFDRELGGVFASARGRWTRRSGVIVRIIDEDGNEGIGEASPLPDYSRESVEAVEHDLEGIVVPARLSADWPEACVQLLGDQLPSPSTVFALETALADLLSHRRGCAMAELWSSTPTQSLSATHVVDAERPLADTREHLAQGFVSFKLKVGRDWSRELELVRILRSELGAIALRLDANGAWSLAEAQRALRDLAALDITWVEQPVAAPLFAELGASPVPLAADESLQAGERAVLPDGAIYVLKPTTVGGLRRCLALATRGPAVISHTLEGPVATATCCELALSLETTPSLPQGIERHPGLASFPEVAVPQLDGASIRRCAHRGHGVRWEHLWAL